MLRWKLWHIRPNDVLQAMKQDSGLDIAQMQVDGGASRNDYLLQFQSDITDTCIVRSTISETTALGAAYLAGLAVGYWKDQDEIRKQFQIGGKFDPQMDEVSRNARNMWLETGSFCRYDFLIKINYRYGCKHIDESEYVLL